MDLVAAWNRLDTETRHAAAVEIAGMRRTPNDRLALAHTLAKRMKFRETTVARMSDTRFAEALVRFLPLFKPDHISAIGAQFLVGPRRQHLEKIYDALGVPHESGELEEGTADTPPPYPHATRLTEALAGEASADLLAFYLEIMSQHTSPAWRKDIEGLAKELGILADALAPSSIEDEIEDDDKNPNLDATASIDGEEENDDATVVAALATPKFSDLDRLLIRTIVSACNHVVGSPRIEELDDLVQEFVELNDGRAQSRFHRGFLDALLDQGIVEDDPGINAERKSWYLAGFLLATLRRFGRDRFITQTLSLSDEDRSILLEQNRAGGAMVAREMTGALLGAGRDDEVSPWLRALIPTIDTNTIHQIDRWAIRSLTDVGPEHVFRVLKTLRKGIAERDDLPDSIQRAIRRRIATTYRLMGRSAEASSIIEELLGSSTSQYERAYLLGERILHTISVTHIETLEVKATETRRAFDAAIAAASDVIDEARANEVPAPIALVTAALPVVGNLEPNEIEREKAIADLDRALDFMTENHAIWRITGLIDRARTYLGLLHLRSFDEGRACEGTRRVLAGLEAGVTIPDDILREAISQSVLAEAPRSARLATLALERQPARFVTEIDVRPLAERSPEIRQRTAEILEQGTGALTVRERLEVATNLLHATAAVRDAEITTRALDILEELGNRFAEAIEPVIALFEDSDLWSFARTPEDHEYALLGLLLRAGHHNRACEKLASLAHRTLTDEGWGVEDLVEQLAELGGDAETVAQLRRRIDAATPTTAEVTEPSPRKARVLFVGGNEMQEAYAPSVTEHFANTCPGVHIDFQHTGWGSNWGRWLTRQAAAFDQADAIVLMRFVRTELGKKVRARASELNLPWIPCTGHGRDAIIRSIRHAIDVIDRA